MDTLPPYVLFKIVHALDPQDIQSVIKTSKCLALAMVRYYYTLRIIRGSGTLYITRLVPVDVLSCEIEKNPTLHEQVEYKVRIGHSRLSLLDGQIASDLILGITLCTLENRTANVKTLRRYFEELYNSDNNVMPYRITIHFDSGWCVTTRGNDEYDFTCYDDNWYEINSDTGNDENPTLAFIHTRFTRMNNVHQLWLKEWLNRQTLPKQRHLLCNGNFVLRLRDTKKTGYECLACGTKRTYANVFDRCDCFSVEL